MGKSSYSSNALRSVQFYLFDVCGNVGEGASADAPAFDPQQRRMILRMFQPGQVVRVNLAGLQAEGVMFQAAVTDAVGHIVKQTSEQPPKYLVKS
jgi:hypothetical protein